MKKLADWFKIRTPTNSSELEPKKIIHKRHIAIISANPNTLERTEITESTETIFKTKTKTKLMVAKIRFWGVLATAVIGGIALIIVAVINTRGTKDREQEIILEPKIVTPEPIGQSEIKQPPSFSNVVESNSGFEAEFFKASSSISIDDMEELAKKCHGLDQFKNTMKCCYWLFKQDTSSKQRERIIKNFKFYNDFWEFSNESIDFGNDISQKIVRGIVWDKNVRFRQKPILEDKYIIQKFELYEEVKILKQGDREKIYIADEKKTVNSYWYRVSTNGENGWVYGYYLMFYPEY